MATSQPTTETVSDGQFGGLTQQLVDNVVQSFTIGTDAEGEFSSIGIAEDRRRKEAQA